MATGAGGGPGEPEDGSGIDPADQWVYDPETGGYQLHMGAEGGASGPTPGNIPGPAAEPPGAAESLGGRQPWPSSTEPTPRPRGSRGSITGATPDGSSTPVGSPAGGRAERRRQQGRQAAGGSTSGTGTSGSQTPEGEGGRADRRRGRGRSTKKATPRRRKVLIWIAASLAFLLVAGGTGVYFIYQHFNGNLKTVAGPDGRVNPATTDGPVNILVIGTDSREGLGKSYGDEGSVGHADTTILLHVAKDRSNATAISIPRDLVTDIPDCKTKGKPIEGQRAGLFNTSLGQDGRDPSCTWKTVESMMDVRVDHFMMVDFNAVKTLSSAVGGVEVCAGKDIDDPKSHLKMSKGRHVVEGDEALAFVRTRHGVGQGGDLTRIPLQQQFMSSFVRKAKSSGTLTNPAKLWKMADAATKALTVDTGIGTGLKLKALAQDIGRVNTKNITFTTVPVVDYPLNKNWLAVKETEADALFDMVRNDSSLTEVKKKQAAVRASEKANSPAGKVRRAEKVPAAQVRVRVVNGSGVTGQAQQALDWMQNEKGYRLSTNGFNADADLAATTVEYAPGQEGQARTLAEDFGLPDTALKRAREGGSGELVLTLGKDFSSPGTPVKKAGPNKGPADLQRVQADDKSVCAK